MRRRISLKLGLWAGAGALGLFAASSRFAAAQSFSNTWFFGDSNSDSGYYIYKPQVIGDPTTQAPPNAGAYTTNPSPEWSQALAAKFGYNATPEDAPGGGTNFAAGGAHVADQNPGTNEWSATKQIATYLAQTGGHADPNALYTVWIGTNDLKTISTPNIIDDPPAIVALGQKTAALVAELYNAGARYFIVPNLETFVSGSFNAFGTTADVVAARALYDQTVWNSIAGAGINFIPADFNTVTNFVLSHGALFGITHIDVNAPACGTVASNFCTPADYVAPNADKTYLFADTGGHVAGSTQQILADYTYGLIVAPSEISYLAEAPVKTRAAVVNSIFEQIFISQRQRAAGSYNAWISGDLSSLKMGNSDAGFPSDPGTPAAVTAGVDYAFAANWLIGAAVSVGTTTQSFSLGGSFRQNEYALSAYTAYAGGPLWFDLIGSFGGLHDDVDRIVPIGITAASNTGSTHGTNPSFATEIGYDWFYPLGAPTASAAAMPTKAAPPPMSPAVLTHGPLAGILLQRVNIDGYTETSIFPGETDSAFTALSFASQLRNSAVTELGYQASIDYGAWRPYAKVTWNHELVSGNRSVTAALTTVAAPSFFMPAVILGRDWASTMLGTTVMLGRGVTGFASFSSEIAQHSVTYYTGEIGVNIALNGPASPPKSGH